MSTAASSIAAFFSVDGCITLLGVYSRFAGSSLFSRVTHRTARRSASSQSLRFQWQAAAIAFVSRGPSSAEPAQSTTTTSTSLVGSANWGRRVLARKCRSPKTGRASFRSADRRQGQLRKRRECLKSLKGLSPNSRLVPALLLITPARGRAMWWQRRWEI